MSVSIPLSVRIPQDDFEWLSTLDIKGASTPSDKLRAIIQRHRREHDGSQSYELALGWLREHIQPFVHEVAAFEHRTSQRSEVVAAMIEWTPQLMALLASEHIDANAGPARARQVEEMLLQRGMALLGTLLRLGITPTTPTYGAAAVERHLPQLGQLIDAVRAARQAE
jgi:hypothetical protein